MTTHTARARTGGDARADRTFGSALQHRHGGVVAGDAAHSPTTTRAGAGDTHRRVDGLHPPGADLGLSLDLGLSHLTWMKK